MAITRAQSCRRQVRFAGSVSSGASSAARPAPLRSAPRRSRSRSVPSAAVQPVPAPGSGQCQLESPFPNGTPLKVDLSTHFFRVELSKFLGVPLRKVLQALKVDIPVSWTSGNVAISTADFEDFVEKFNESVANFKSRRASRRHLPPILLHNTDEPLPYEVLKGIAVFVRDIIIRDERDLEAKAYGDTKYGATADDQIRSIVDELKMGKDDVFVDLGSGIGNVVCMIAAYARVKEAVGVEMVGTAAGYAQAHHKLFQEVLSFLGHHNYPIKLYHDSFTLPQYKDLIQKKATVVFTNNIQFNPNTMNTLKEWLAEGRDDLKIISTDEIVSTKRSERSNPLTQITTTSQLKIVEHNASWQGEPCPYYLTTIDKSKIPVPAVSAPSSSGSRARSARASSSRARF